MALRKGQTTFNNADHHLAQSGLSARWARRHPSSPIHLDISGEPKIVEELNGATTLHAWGWKKFVSAIDVLKEFKDGQ